MTPSREPSDVHPNRVLLERFYAAFDRHDAATMGACYHDEATFSDPAFPHLDAAATRAMWTMLTGQAPDLRVMASGLDADDERGRASWVATYTFSTTKRFVENRIEARFRFKDGLILRHEDHFDFWRWSRQALGPVGLALGWSPLLKTTVQRTAARGLRRHRERRADPRGAPGSAADGGRG